MQNFIHSRREIKPLEKIREGVVGGPSIDFTRKTVVDETFFSKVYKYMQIHCWDWRQSNKSLLDVSTQAYRSFTLGDFDSETGGFTPQKQQDPQLQKYGPLLFPTNKSRWKWKILCKRQTEKKWLLFCWWVFFALQICVRKNGLLLPLLPVSRSTSLSQWRGYSLW